MCDRWTIRYLTIQGTIGRSSENVRDLAALESAEE
jgi:hypothetical protein